MKAIIDARNDKKLPIYYHIQENMPQNLEGDAVRIKQVMLNYASNAIKYTESGQIDITVGCEEMQDGLVNLIYTVKDTGQGIREEDISKLFLMYSQHPPARMIMRIKIMISNLFNFFLFMPVTHHSCLKISSSQSAYCFIHPPSEPKPCGHPFRTIRLVWIPIFLITSYCSSN